jgi:S-disulfanyl-L-cysteine oxidoreductase SoxD
MKFKIVTLAIIGLAAGACISTLRAQSDTRSVWDGVFTEDQAKRGQPAYNENCSSCHGDTLSGGEMAPALAGGDFLSNWNGLTVGDLYDRIRTTMPLNKPGKLTREMNADILAYIMRANQFPAGQTELAHQSEVLKQIRFEATKPEKK